MYVVFQFTKVIVNMQIHTPTQVFMLVFQTAIIELYFEVISEREGINVKSSLSKPKANSATQLICQIFVSLISAV